MQYISDKVYRNVSIYESFFSFLDGEDLSITTEALSKKDRSKMKDDEFAVPSIRKYPINNEESIKMELSSSDLFQLNIEMNVQKI